MWKSLLVVVCAAVALFAVTWTGDVRIVKPQSVSAQGVSCPGDFNGDGKVNLADFLAFAGGFGARSGDANYDARLDMDGSGAVDLSDFLAFAGVFGTNCSDRPVGSVSGDRAALVALYNATDGPNWVDNTNWLTDAPLEEWYGVGVDADGRVISLDIQFNELNGPIPPELGNLSNLKTLNLSNNLLAGPIPPELGNLSNLTELSLAGNQLTGPIPPEFGNLSNLETLFFSQNPLNGPIPHELGNLSNLRVLYLVKNQLTGPIPEKLGGLSNLTILSLSNNGLNGPIPPELGNLSNLRLLYLDKNQMTGPVPSEFRGLTSLRELWLSNNPGIEGPLPADLTALNRLDLLQAGGTNLCAPSDAGFRAWLADIDDKWIGFCSDAELPPAYLTQAVQSREFPVPLVAGERALLRVFPTANRATSESIPAVRARIYRDGRETHVEEIPGGSAPIPTEVDEGDLDKSVNARIPGHLIQPGLEMVIEIDPHGTLDSALGVTTRIPTSGRMAVEVGAMPPFDLTLVPFIWQDGGDSSIVDLVRDMVTDPENHEMLEDTRMLLPIANLQVRAHVALLSSSNNGSDLYTQTKAIRVMEGAPGHYMGMMARPVTGPSGQAQRPGQTGFSIPDAAVLAHELGHNLSLGHAPCNVLGDPRFPYPDGSIGAWGYDFTGGGRLLSPSTAELMSYCHPRWISDYHFIQAFQFRLSNASGAVAIRSVSASRGLLLWGGVDAAGVLFMEPAFVVESPPALPKAGGEYWLTGRTGGNAELFTFSFDMPEIADGDGRSSFVFALPLKPEWAGNLTSITLAGPGGSATLDQNTDRPMAILRDLQSGQVRGFLSDLTAEEAAQAAEGAFAAKPGVEVMFSRGIPDLR